MLLEIYDIEPFKNFFDLIYDSATIIEMKLDSNNCSIQLLNNSHVCFYNIIYSKEFFGDYEVDGAESVLIFVEDFYKILKSSNKDDVLTLRTDESFLYCVFEHDNNRRVFELPLADDYNASPVPPSIDYDGEFTVLLDELKQPCNDLDKIIKTDRFRMSTSDNRLTITSPSDAMTNYSQTILIDSDVSASCIVNLNYILDLMKLSKISKEVIIKIGDNLPLTWDIQSYDGLIKVNGLIAPVIEEE